MAYYRFYFLDHQEHIRRALDVQCKDDVDAIEQAIQRLDGRALEIWQGERPVRRVNADGSTSTMVSRSAPLGGATRPAT